MPAAKYGCPCFYVHKSTDNEFVFNVICNAKFAVSQNSNPFLCKIKHASFHMLLFFLKCENAYLDNKICTLHYSHCIIFFTKKQILYHVLQNLGRLGMSATSVSSLSWALWKRSYRSASTPDVSFPWCVDILG